MTQPCSSPDRNMSSWVESPKRPGNSAREVVIANTEAVPVFFQESGSGFLQFNEISSIASGVTTPVITYTVPVGNSVSFSEISVSGNQMATFELFINNDKKQIKRSSLTQYNCEFNINGFSLSEGDVLKIEVTHNRPMSGTFSCTLNGRIS